MCTLLVAGLIVALAGVAPNMTGEDPNAIRAAHATLDRRLPELHLDAARLEDVMTFMQDVTGLDMQVDWDHLATQNVHRTTPISYRLRDVPLRKALTIVLDSTGYRGSPYPYEIDGRGRLMVGAKPSIIVRQYECRDLLIGIPVFEPDNDVMSDIIQLLATTIDPESWQDAGGTIGTIRHEQGVLIIRQTSANHRQIANLMSKLRGTRNDYAWAFSR